MSAPLTWGCKHDEGCGFYVIGYATLRFAARTGSAKDLARDTGANWRTVQGYQSGRSRPDPYFLLSLMRANDAFAAGLLRLAGWAEAARAINEAANARKQIELDATWARMDRAPPPRR